MLITNILIFFLFLLIMSSTESLAIFSNWLYRYFTDKILFQLRQSYYVLTLQFGYTGNGWGVNLINKSKEYRSASQEAITSRPFYCHCCFWVGLYPITASSLFAADVALSVCPSFTSESHCLLEQRLRINL